MYDARCVLVTGHTLGVSYLAEITEPVGAVYVPTTQSVKDDPEEYDEETQLVVQFEAIPIRFAHPYDDTSLTEMTAAAAAPPGQPAALN